MHWTLGLHNKSRKLLKSTQIKLFITITERHFNKRHYTFRSEHLCHPFSNTSKRPKRIRLHSTYIDVCQWSTFALSGSGSAIYTYSWESCDSCKWEIYCPKSDVSPKRRRRWQSVKRDSSDETQDQTRPSKCRRELQSPDPCYIKKKIANRH